MEYTPTIRLKTVDGRILEYEGNRSLDDLLNWIRRNVKSGTTRTTYAGRGATPSLMLFAALITTLGPHQSRGFALAFHMLALSAGVEVRRSIAAGA